MSYFFPGGLNQLLVDSYNSLSERSIAELKAAAEKDGRSAEKRLQAIFELYFSSAWLEDTLVGAYVSLWSLSRTDLDLKAAMSGLHRQQTDAIAGPLSELAAERRAKVNIKLLADCLVIFLNGLWLDIGLNPQNITPKRAREMCWAWLDGSLSSSKPGRTRGR